MRRTISGDPAEFKVKAKEKTYISAAPTNLCQGKTTMFLHYHPNMVLMATTMTPLTPMTPHCVQR